MEPEVEPETEPVTVEAEAPAEAPVAYSTGLRYKAVYDYTAADDDEVSFVDGDIIVDVEQIDEGWITVGCMTTRSWPVFFPLHFLFLFCPAC